MSIKAPIASVPPFWAVRRILTALGAALLVAVVAIGLASAGGGEEEEPSASGPGLAGQKAALADAPGPLRELYARAGELLDGEADAFRERLEALEGYPVVVNKWASWCGPCRVEFPHFRDQALEHGRRIAFIGVNSADNDADARRFLEELPVPFPSYRDPDSKVAEVFRGVAAFPTTAFYDSRGDLVYVKQGQYRTEADLAADIRRYAK